MGGRVLTFPDDKIYNQGQREEREKNLIFMLSNGMEDTLRKSPEYSDEEIDRAKKKLLQPVK